MHKFQIGLLTVVVLVGLRLALGCHFLYEGLWKIEHSDFFYKGASELTRSDDFNAEPFLTSAKGPVAWLFYKMVPDIDGRERLHVTVDSKKQKSINTEALEKRWDAIQQDFVAHYRPGASDEKEAKDFEDGARQTYNTYKDWMREYFNENIPAIEEYFGALDRFEGKADAHHKETGQDAPFQRERNWKEMMKLRQEADGWIKDIESQEKAYKNSLYALLSDAQKKRAPGPQVWNPLRWSQREQINFIVTFALTAIGACLMLGLCSRPAALGGAGFMCFVVMTQPAFPGIYPPDPLVVGHALLINKDFIEMMALLVIASVPAGRWGGLDFFLYRIVRWFFPRRSKASESEGDLVLAKK